MRENRKIENVEEKEKMGKERRKYNEMGKKIKEDLSTERERKTNLNKWSTFSIFSPLWKERKQRVWERGRKEIYGKKKVEYKKKTRKKDEERLKHGTCKKKKETKEALQEGKSEM